MKALLIALGLVLVSTAAQACDESCDDGTDHTYGYYQRPPFGFGYRPGPGYAFYNRIDPNFGYRPHGYGWYGYYYYNRGGWGY